MSAVPPPPALPENVDEDIVRRLCGAGPFAEADKLQRDGHVLSPTFGEDGLEASVRGTWRRVDQVAVNIRARRLQPECTRHGAVFCQHAGALLLQCLRDPDSFATTEQADHEAVETSRPGQRAVRATNGAMESPAAELARLLEQDTANHLREIARQRGVRLSGTRKADIVEQMTSILMEPDGIDAAIEELSPAGRQALDAIHLLGDESPVPVEAVRDGAVALGGNGKPPLDALLDAGLIVLPNRQAYGPDGYLVPRAVAARLPLLDNLAHQADVPQPANTEDQTPRLGIAEMIQVMAQASLAGRISLQQRARRTDWLTYAPPGFVFDPAEVPGGVLILDRSHTEGIRLLPQQLLADTDLERLSDRTGQPSGAVDFVARLMLDIQIAERARDGLSIRFDRLQALLDMAPSERLARLAHGWLLAAGPSVLYALFGAGGPLDVRWQPAFAMWGPPLQPAVVSAARLVARLVSRMTTDRIYHLTSFARTVERLAPLAAPSLVQLRATPPNMQALAITSRVGGSKKERVALRAPEGWSRFLAALVGALLAGPMAWLGLVEVEMIRGHPLAFRVRPEAGLLRDRHVASADERTGKRLTVGDDMTVLVPPEAADVAIHGLFSRAGELVDASMNGLRYRLTPAGVRAIFDTGMSGPELTGLLDDHAGGTVPETVREELDRWWRHYGTIRLYDELTVVELNDDFLLSELTAATSLPSAIIQVFSPRLIAIDSTCVDEVIDDLTERGYAPRVIEAS